MPSRRSVLLGLIGLVPASGLRPTSGVANAGLRTELLRLPPLRGAFGAGDLQGRVVVVAFFASWCPPCRPEFAHLNAVQQAYGRDLLVVGVNVFETFGGLSNPAKLERFLEDTRPAFPIVRGDRAIRQAFFGLDRIPSLFVFDRLGDLRTIFRHQRDATKTHLSEAELRAAIEPLL